MQNIEIRLPEGMSVKNGPRQADNIRFVRFEQSLVRSPLESLTIRVMCTPELMDSPLLTGHRKRVAIIYDCANIAIQSLLDSDVLKNPSALWMELAELNK